MRDLFFVPNIITPWPFQDRVIKKVVSYVRSYNGTRLTGVVVAPTGSGKSVMIAHSVYKIAQPTIILQPSKELLEQNYKKFIDHGGNATIYSASAGSKNPSSCMFATPASLKGKGDFLRQVFKIKVLIIDECHFKVKTEREADEALSMVLQFIEDLQPEVIIGFTATPIRLVTSRVGPTLNMLNRGDNKLFHDIIEVVQIKEVEDYWKKLNYKLYDFDESKLVLNSTGMDFTEESIKLSVSHNNVNNSICKEVLLQHDEGKRSMLAFVDSVETGHKMADWINRKGVKAVCIDGKTPLKLREKQVEAFKDGDLELLINHSAFTTGFDHKPLDTVFLGRPTNSFSMLYQKIGRLVRMHETIKTGLCIDFCNNVKRLGYINEITFDEIPGYGWGMFRGDILMTGRPLKFAKKTKLDLELEAQVKVKIPYTKIHFGKYRGDHISTLTDDYLKYCLNFDVKHDDKLMAKFMVTIKNELENRSQENFV